MSKSDKKTEKEMTLCETCVAILEESRDIIFDFISHFILILFIKAIFNSVSSLQDKPATPCP